MSSWQLAWLIGVTGCSGTPLPSQPLVPHVVAAVVVSFSVLVTIHVVGSFALTRLRPHWNGAVALFVPPFFPYYALRRRKAGWAVAWITAALTYAAALGIAGWR